MATQANLDLVQNAYVSFFGRPADPDGQVFWADAIESGAESRASLFAAFEASVEGQQFVGQTNAEVINDVYQNALGRAYDATTDGTYWLDQLNDGEVKGKGETAQAILDGAIKNDVQAVQNRLEAANNCTVAFSESGIKYDLEIAMESIAEVDHTTASVTQSASFITDTVLPSVPDTTEPTPTPQEPDTSGDSAPEQFTIYDKSSATEDLNVDLTDTPNKIAKILTGSGDDKVLVDVSDLAVNVEINGSEGADELALSGELATIAPNIAGFETLDLTAITTNGSISLKNSTDISTITLADNASFQSAVTLEETANDINVSAQSEHAGGLSVDNTGKTVVTLMSTPQQIIDKTTQNNRTSFTFNESDDFSLIVKDYINYEGTINTSKAAKILLQTASQASEIQLNSQQAETLNITAGNNLTLTGNQDKVHTLTIDTQGKTQQLSGYTQVTSVSLSGDGADSSVELANLGSSSLGGSMNVTANGLVKGLTIGNINTGSNDLTVNLNDVTGTINLGNLSSAILTIEADRADKAITTGTLTGSSIFIDVSDNLNSLATDIITAESIVKINGSGTAANSANIHASNGSTILKTTIEGGSSLDTFSITGGQNQTEINVDGDLKGNDSDKLTITLVDSSENQSIDLSALANATTLIDISAEGDNTLTIIGSKGTDTLRLGANKNYSADGVTNSLTFSAIENLDLTTLTDTMPTNLDASLLSGQSIHLEGGESLFLSGKTGIETIDLSDITGTATLNINSQTGSDHITLSAMDDVVFLDTSDASETDTILSFTQGVDKLAFVNELGLPAIAAALDIAADADKTDASLIGPGSVDPDPGTDPGTGLTDPGPGPGPVDSGTGLGGSAAAFVFANGADGTGTDPSSVIANYEDKADVAEFLAAGLDNTLEADNYVAIINDLAADKAYAYFVNVDGAAGGNTDAIQGGDLTIVGVITTTSAITSTDIL